jgi:serine protease
MDGHGTHVASIILEDTNNSVGTAGIAYQASLLPLKVCIGYWELQILKSGSGQPGFVDQNNAGDCPDDAIAQAIRYAADSGAQVINVSLSGPDPAPLLREAVSYAVSHGSFVAMAVGNEFQDGNPVEYPAAYAAQISGAMAVGAVGRSSKRAPYSNTGSHLEIVAPGGDFDDGGLNGMVTAVAPNFLDFDPSTSPRPRFDRYSLVSVEGTSAAAPHIVGVAALLSSQGIATPSAIESAIERTATDLGQAGRDNEFGFGLVNARRALRGMGLVK